MFPPELHQFHPSCAIGDGVTNGMLFTRRLLRSMGFTSEIYCDHIPAGLRNEVRHSGELQHNLTAQLLVHHSLGYENDAWLKGFGGRAVLVYHNITPPHLLPADGPWRRLAALGRQQLLDWCPLFCGAIGVSEFNADELRAAGYESPRAIPLLVDLDGMSQRAWDASFGDSYLDTTNILFVGRLAPNKRHDLLLAAFAEYLHYADSPARLILPGSAVDQAYAEQLKEQARQLGVEPHVDFLGHISDHILGALYRVADLYVSTSDHEGFGMPLIEAALFGVPVIACAKGAVPETMGEGGLLLETDDPASIGALMHTVLTEPALRRRMRQAQASNLRRFDATHVAAALAGFLGDLGIQVPQPWPSSANSSPRWQVEGPFDSSYSLAIVNRQVARALARQGRNISLSITPGTAEPIPGDAFLDANPDIRQMTGLAEASDPPDVTLRFTYPPRTDRFFSRVCGVHSYGWEETGFPQRYVDWFNNRLDLVTVLSRQVEKILRDAGVMVPIIVSGAGADQFPPDASPVSERIQFRKTYRFLHISSAFPRKGVDALLAAYAKAFRASDDVSLIIKAFPNPHNDVAKQLSKWRQTDPGFPDVVLIDEDWNAAALAQLYKDCNAFVSAARGEGFGLPMAEAMLAGLPVITTGWGGQTDFCRDDTAWLIDYRFAPADTHLQIDHSAWAEPSIDHLALLLRQVHGAKPAELQIRTSAAKALIEKQFTWDRVADDCENAVAALERLPLFAIEPKVGWLSTWNTRCGLATYSQHLAGHIPLDRLVVLADEGGVKIQPDAASVERCWRQGQRENIDSVIQQLDSKGIDALVIQYNFGFFPLSELARLLDACHATGRHAHLFLHATKDVDKPGFCASLSEIKTSLRDARSIYVHSIDDLNRLRELGCANNTALFPHGVPALQSADETHPASQILAGKRVIASYGFLLPHKGLVQLVEAFALLASSAPDLHLVLCNALYPAPESVAERNAVQAAIARHRLQQRVTLITDFLSEADSAAWLTPAQVIVFPYQETAESASGAVRMGYTVSRPVAVSPLAIFDDLGDTVERLPGTSPEQIAKGLQTMLTDTTGQVARTQRQQRIAAERAWPKVAKRFWNILRAHWLDRQWQQALSEQRTGHE